MIEAAVIEWQRARVANLELHSRIRIEALGMLYIDRREVDGTYTSHLWTLRESERQAPGATADIEDMFTLTDAGEVDEQWCESAAPAAHQAFVTTAIASHEDRRSHRASRTHLSPPIT